MPNFIDQQVRLFFQEDGVRDPKYWVEKFVKYYNSLYVAAIKKGRPRKTSGLSSAQWALSLFKKQLATYGIPSAYLEELKLYNEQASILANQRNDRLVTNATNLEKIDAYELIKNCRTWVKNDKQPSTQLLALAGLTGRRVSELIFSIELLPPSREHKNQQYWSCMMGFAKTKQIDRCRDCPMFEKRNIIQAAIENIRKHFPANSISEVNKKYGIHIMKTMQQHLPHVKKIHNLRKLYVQIAFHHFNETNASIVKLSSEILGHYRLSQAVLPYMSSMPINIDKIKFP
jgi:hypothetical protein